MNVFIEAFLFCYKVIILDGWGQTGPGHLEVQRIFEQAFQELATEYLKQYPNTLEGISSKALQTFRVRVWPAFEVLSCTYLLVNVWCLLFSSSYGAFKGVLYFRILAWLLLFWSKCLRVLNSPKSYLLIAGSHGFKESKSSSETEKCIEVLYASRKRECVTDRVKTSADFKLWILQGKSFGFQSTQFG